MAITKIRIALDWTPNTIHSGLFIALQRGLYKDKNLDVELLSPDATYSKTPAKRLESGEVDLAICPSESCIAYQESGAMKLQAIYAILQRDASAIASTKSKFARAAQLQKGKYGSYNARYEDRIVRAMVTADGGDGNGMQIVNSAGKLSLFEESKKGSVDATWIFISWEGVEAEEEGIKLNMFKTEDAGIPYGYSPVIARNASAKHELPAGSLKQFLNATRRGYEIASTDPDTAAKVLGNYCDRGLAFLSRSQSTINHYYTNGEERLGLMSEQKWMDWVRWLEAAQILEAGSIDSRVLFSNDFNEGS